MGRIDGKMKCLFEPIIFSRKEHYYVMGYFLKMKELIVYCKRSRKSQRNDIGNREGQRIFESNVLLTFFGL